MGDAALPLRLLQQEVGVLRQRVAELEAARMAEARRTQALLGRLAAGLSHELRNPLGAVVLHMDLLEEILRQPATNSEDEVVQALSEIRTNPTRLYALSQHYPLPVRTAPQVRTQVTMGAA